MTDSNRAGFTLVELMLAMAFISFILIFSVNAVLQVTRLYTKGLAIRQINQTGRQVMDTLGKSVRYAKPTYLASDQRLCAGGVSYAWNVENTPIVNEYTDGTAVRFVSVKDPMASLCESTVPNIQKSTAVDLVGGDITPLLFSIDKRGMMWDIKLVLSTAGTNIAVNVATPPAVKYECDPDNQFCAFGDFETSIYSREK